MRWGLRPTSPWVQLSPEPDDLAAPYSERRDGSDGTLQPANAPQRKGSTPSAKRICESGIASICNAMHRFPFDVLLGRGRILVGARAPFNVTSVDNAAAAVLGMRAEAVWRSVAVLALEHSDRLRLLEACDHASGTGWREHRRAVLAVDKSLLFVVQNQATRAHPALEVLVFRPGPQHMTPVLPVLGQRASSWVAASGEGVLDEPVFLQGPFKVRGAWQVRATVEDLCFRVRLRVALRVCPVHRRIDPLLSVSVA